MRADFKADPISIAVVAFSSDHSREHDHHALIERCLLGIIERTDASKYRLHVGCNNLSPRVMALVEDLCDRGLATCTLGEPRLDAEGNIFHPKYPLMDTLYRSTRSPWVAWFDDDSYPEEDDWLERLEDAINEHPSAHQFGKLAATPLADTDRRWIEEASWFNPDVPQHWVELDDDWQALHLEYIVGGFYAISREAIEQCSIPDRRLLHNRGDWTTGLALHHQGFGIQHHTYGVRINAAPRRGAHDDLWRGPGEAAQLQDTSITRAREKFRLARDRREPARQRGVQDERA